MKGHQVELETMLEYLINGENEEAGKLFHQIVVEKSRNIYTESMGDELEEAEDELEEDADTEELDEDFGGDPKADYADSIEADTDEVDSEEDIASEDSEDEFSMEDEMDGGEDAPEMEGDTDDRLEDIESAIVELSAEFHQVASGLGIELNDEEDMMGDDEFAPMDDEPDEFASPMDDMDSDDDYSEMEEALAEATAFLKNVADAGMGQEGQEAGTGPSIPVNKKSINDERKRQDFGGKPVNFAGGSAESGGSKASAKDEACEDNVDVKPTSAPKPKTKVEDDKSASSLLATPPKKRK